MLPVEALNGSSCCCCCFLLVLEVDCLQYPYLERLQRRLLLGRYLIALHRYDGVSIHLSSKLLTVPHLLHSPKSTPQLIVRTSLPVEDKEHLNVKFLLWVKGVAVSELQSEFLEGLEVEAFLPHVVVL
jgi:hypothetical protein